MIEVMVVVAIVAIAAGVVSLALRDGAEVRLEREAERLATLFETARAEARAAGLPVRWVLTPDAGEDAFRFVGLPASRRMPTRWTDAEVTAQLEPGRQAVVLGPEPLIGAQRVQLAIGERRLGVATDGLRPFAAGPLDAAASP